MSISNDTRPTLSSVIGKLMTAKNTEINGLLYSIDSSFFYWVQQNKRQPKVMVINYKTYANLMSESVKHPNIFGMFFNSHHVPKTFRGVKIIKTSDVEEYEFY